ncbi:MAG TPA: ATP-binding protein [Abditibacteriaceae bacterium]|jgi:signal transduction histidine kinase/ActR/RegA family two-component response regulator
MDTWLRLFDPTGFVPRAQCGQWTPALIRLHNVSDFLIWTAYLAIPVVLIRFAYKRRRELPFRQLFWLFGLFIVACGTTHLMDIILFYNPLYRLSGVVKLVTAAASWGTVIALVPIVPRALAMRTPESLEREVDERKRAEEEVRVLNTELEQRVQERTAELQAINHQLEAANREKDILLRSEQTAREESERANRAKDEFLATLSHELRTPLNSIYGWTQLLRGGKMDDETTGQALETIERSTRAQVQLIDDLLDVSRIITGKLPLDMQPVDLAPTIEAALSSARPAAMAKNIEINAVLHPDAGLISGDPHRLQQVVWNIISNALKFTPKGGRVDVLLHRVNSQVEIEVTDNGQGIEPEFLPYIFERFRQADSTSTRRFGGLGLGLAIVRHLVELHGGTAQALSEGIGRGATIRVRFPVLAVSTPGSNAAGRDGANGSAAREAHTTLPEGFLSGIRVLVVDDEIDARAMVTATLTLYGAQVETASSASESLHILDGSVIDVLVSDIGMPDADGISLIQELRTRSEASNGRIPAIALTAYASPSDRTRVLASGFQMHMSKPCDPEELAAAVASLAGRTATNGEANGITNN